MGANHYRSLGLEIMMNPTLKIGFIPNPKNLLSLWWIPKFKVHYGLRYDWKRKSEKNQERDYMHVIIITIIKWERDKEIDLDTSLFLILKYLIVIVIVLTCILFKL